MKGISAYILDEPTRSELALWHFPPRFEKFVGHHVTYQFGSSDKDPLPPAGTYTVVGYAYEQERRPGGSGIEALVVAIDGKTTRPDGGTYHITWSLGPGYAPKNSNDIIAKGWTKLDPDDIVKIKMEPVFLPFN